MLKDKKTIIGMVALGVFLIQGGLFPELLSDRVEDILLGVIATWTGVSLRVAIKKAQK